MKNKLLLSRIGELIEKIARTYAAWKQSENVPFIESEILLEDLRKLYVLQKELNAELQFDENSSTMKVVGHTKTQNIPVIPPPEAIKEEEPEIEKTKSTPPPAPSSSEEKTVEKTPTYKPINLFDEMPHKVKFEEKETLHDRIAESREDKSLGTKLKMKPIRDLKAAIGINEKFIFLNELFEGDSTDYNNIIDDVNQCASFEEAEQKLRSGPATKYNWNLRNKFVRNDFMELVQRRFV